MLKTNQLMQACLLGSWLFCQLGIALAQPTTADSLWQQLRHLPADTNRVNTLNALLHEGDFASIPAMQRVADESITLSHHLNYPKGEITARLNQAVCYIMRSDYPAAKRCYDAVGTLVLNTKAVSLLPLRAAYYSHMAAYYGELGDYEHAILSSKEQVRITERLNNWRSTLFGYHGMANVCRDLNLYQEALHYSQQGVARLGSHVPGLLYILYEGISASSLELALRQPPGPRRDSCARQALNYAQAGLRQATKIKMYAFMAAFGTTLGRYYLEVAHQPAQALTYLNQSLVWAEQTGYGSVLNETRLHVAQALVAQQQYGRALPYARLAAAGFASMGALRYEANSQKILGLIHNGLGHPDSASHYLVQFAQLQDTLWQTENSRQLLRLKVQFDVERQGFEIAQLNHQNALQLAQTARQRTTRNGIIGGSGVLLLLLGVVYSQFRVKSRANRQLRQQQIEINLRNQQLQQSLEEKDVLLKEIHHRVKNNLQLVTSLLSLQRQATADEAVGRAIREGQNRVKSIALIHEKLYQSDNLSRIDFQEYAHSLGTYLMHCSPPEHVQLRLESEPIRVDVDTAVRLGLIITELITNALKHAFPTNFQPLSDHNQPTTNQIVISFRQPAARLFELQVADNGVGMPIPPAPDGAGSGSLGLRLVHILTRQLGGKLGIDSPRGTRVRLLFNEPLIA
jgi:two-component sensor histidine kinase